MFLVSRFVASAALLATALALPMPDLASSQTSASPASGQPLTLALNAKGSQGSSSSTAYNPQMTGGQYGGQYGGYMGSYSMSANSPQMSGGQYGDSSMSPMNGGQYGDKYDDKSGGKYGDSSMSSMNGGQYGGYMGSNTMGSYSYASSPQMTQAPSYDSHSSMGSNDYSSSSPSYSAPSYGSGSSNWGGSGYDSCVQQCMASYGAPPYQYQPTATSSAGSKGTGATHTVIVAPSQGILRYVPFAVNASVGDTIQFMWGANNHTVTKSSALTPCNKSSDALFASGTQNKNFQFTQAVNSTDPVWFYCGTPGHCQKGMFGVLNPSNNYGSSSSVDVMMGNMAQNDSNMAAMWSYMNQMTQGNSDAASWGGSLDLSSVPQWAQQYMMENVMYTRSFLAMNKDVLQPDGSINLNTSNPLSFPNDMSAALSTPNSGSSTSSSPPSNPAAAASSSTPSSGASAAADTKKNGASSVTSSKGLLILMAVIATSFAL